jgi:hypothetical protein
MNRRTALRTMGGLFVAALGCNGASTTQTKPQRAPNEGANKLAGDNNEFAFDLYAKVRETNGNLFFSPASVSTALAMTYAGARGNTADQMAKVMHFNLGQSELHPAFAGLLRDERRRNRSRKARLSIIRRQRPLGTTRLFLEARVPQDHERQLRRWPASSRFRGIGRSPQDH